MPTLSRLSGGWLFPLLVVALAFVEYGVAQSRAFATHTDLLAFAVTVDIVAGIPLLGYFILVRPRRAPAMVLAPLFLLALLLAHLILPESGKQYLRGVELLLPLLEIALLLYAISKVRKVLQRYRELRPTAVYPTDALEQSLHQILGNSPAIGIVLTEFSLLYYAIGGWFLCYHPTHEQHRPFTYHLKSGYSTLAAMMIGLSLVEIPLVHLVVNHFNPIAAWILTLLTLYTILWIIGDYHAIRLHPLVLDEGQLHLRAGMRWRLSLAFDQIRLIRPLHFQERQNKAILDLSIAGNGKWLIELNQPTTVRGLFGIKRVTEKIAFAVDDEKTFLELWNSRK